GRGGGCRRPRRCRRRSSTSCRPSPARPRSPAHSARETAGTLPAHGPGVVRGPAARPAAPPRRGCNACGHRTRYIPSAASPLAADTAECFTHTHGKRPRAETQRFHAIKTESRPLERRPCTSDGLEAWYEARVSSPFRPSTSGGTKSLGSTDGGQTEEGDDWRVSVERDWLVLDYAARRT